MSVGNIPKTKGSNLKGKDGVGHASQPTHGGLVPTGGNGHPLAGPGFKRGGGVLAANRTSGMQFCGKAGAHRIGKK